MQDKKADSQPAVKLPGGNPGGYLICVSAGEAETFTLGMAFMNSINPASVEWCSRD